jgi:hypothetical protein
MRLPLRRTYQTVRPWRVLAYPGACEERRGGAAGAAGTDDGDTQALKLIDECRSEREDLAREGGRSGSRALGLMNLDALADNGDRARNGGALGILPDPGADASLRGEQHGDKLGFGAVAGAGGSEQFGFVVVVLIRKIIERSGVRCR